MKKIREIFFYSAALILLLAFACNTEKSVKDGRYVIDIYATNDIHGCFFDSTYNDGVNETSISKVSHFIKSERERRGEESIVLLDVGDNLQGDNSVFYYNYIDTTSTNLVMEAFNYLKYDAVVVGNHDIETGHRVYDKMKKGLNASYLAANAVSTTSGTPYFQPYTIIVRQGIKIAVIGLTNANIKKWLSPVLYSGITFDEIIPVLEKYVKEVREKESPDIVIAAMHAGLGDENIYQMEDPSKYISSHVKGLDLVFAAHDHKTFAGFIHNGNDSLALLEGGSKAQNLAHAAVALEFKDGKVVNKNVSVSIIQMKHLNSDPQYNNFFSERFNAVKSFTNMVIGKIDRTISSRDAYFGPSGYIDMIQSLQLEYTSADISFVAPLSLDITVYAGDLNFQNLLNLYPFENQLYTISMTGQEVKDYLEYSYMKWVNKVDKPNVPMLKTIINDKGLRRFENMHFNFDSAAGILYNVELKKGDGERVKILSMSDGKPFDTKKTYVVAMSSYRANGGGDLLTSGAGIPFEELEDRVISRMSDIRSLIYEKLKKDGHLSPRKLNNWKFVPESLVLEKSAKEYKELFK